MKKRFLLLIFLIFAGKILSQKNFNIPAKFPTQYGTFTFPLGSKVVLELKENGNTYEYRVLSMEPYKDYYPLSKKKNIFSKDIKENTIEIFFTGAYYNDGKEDKEWKSLLSLKSNVKTPLIYKADIKYYFKNEFENTSISGIFPNAKINEIWGHKIDFITLYDFEKLKK
ncbi:hypothetical protein [Chryseobacterium hagamense]|uniref:Uncharacterized protein n=1 Tax=Chryseobacterium hagamense TaxID=395935 RepID=A0A511YPG8_9FLAO|nr:hypothetical protein [Chryseobacterium hagamense]GEN77094.1 hypothetical protein CHA01nite_28340 [Chryseobacterium hagamense]